MLVVLRCPDRHSPPRDPDSSNQAGRVVLSHLIVVRLYGRELVIWVPVLRAGGAVLWLEGNGGVRIGTVVFLNAQMTFTSDTGGSNRMPKPELNKREPGTRRVKLCVIDLPANLGITQGQALNHSNVRRYCHQKNMTLPDAIEVEACTVEDGWRIVVWENPDNGI